jgi:hypothetical protein
MTQLPTRCTTQLAILWPVLPDEQREALRETQSRLRRQVEVKVEVETAGGLGNGYPRKQGTVPRSANVELGAVQSPFSASFPRLGRQNGRGVAAVPRPFSSDPENEPRVNTDSRADAAGATKVRNRRIQKSETRNQSPELRRRSVNHG